MPPTDCTPTDEALMSEFQRGHDGGNVAFNTIILRWQQPIKGFLYRLLQNPHAAEDIAQEVFLRVYTRKAQFRPGARFSPWIYSIANNLAKNHRRNIFRWGWVQNMSENENWEVVPGAEEDPQKAAVAKEETEAVKKALALLADDDRTVVVLLYYQQLSIAEIAESVGLSEKAVEMKLYRARQKLKTVLKLS